LTSARSFSEANCPEVRTEMRSGPASITPAGVTAFCDCRLCTTWRWSMPRAASLRVEKFR
jgi:hypothetical protein